MDTEEASTKLLLETFNKIKSEQLNELRQDNEFCDLTLKCEDGFEIRVHKNVLSSASNYFKDLLTLPMKEKFEESIKIPDITGNVLENIITFIYTSKFEQKFENIEKIIKYAVIFQLQQLVEICLLSLNKSINDHTCVKYWRLGRTNLINDLESKCLAYIVSKADHLFQNSLMSDLTIEEMRSLLGDKRLHLQCNEKKIFEHVWKWAKEKVSETKSFSQVFSEVVDLFNYAELKQEFILPRIFFDDDLTENAEPLWKIAKLTKQKYKEVASRHIFHKPNQRRLIGLAQNKMFIGLGEENIITKEKTNLQEYFGYTTFDNNNKFFICGGEKSNSCEIFEPSTQQWKQFPSMKTQRQQHQCSCLDNKIYAFGGIDSKSVEIFDLGKGEWDYGPQMLTNNYNFGLTRVNGAFYAIGGNKNNNVEVLDIRTQKWNIVNSDFKSNYGFVCCVSIGRSIYCFTFDKTYIFDTRLNKFTKEICVANFNHFLNFCEHDGYIYGFAFKKVSADKESLKLIQYDLDGKQQLEKSYGSYNSNEIVAKTALVSLYYE